MTFDEEIFGYIFFKMSFGLEPALEKRPSYGPGWSLISRTVKRIKNNFFCMLVWNVVKVCSCSECSQVTSVSRHIFEIVERMVFSCSQVASVCSRLFGISVFLCFISSIERIEKNFFGKFD
jgi:hypothetical protein